MSGRRFPVAVYGKPPADSPDRARDYGLLGFSPGFPVVLAPEVERIARALRWSSGGAAEVHAPCYALWPLPAETPEGAPAAPAARMPAVRMPAARMLAVRMLDVGRDEAGRRHTLRVEVAYLGPRPWDAVQTLSLLTDSAWPNAPAPLAETLSTGILLAPSADPRRLPEPLARRAPDLPRRPLFRGHPGACPLAGVFVSVGDADSDARAAGSGAATTKVDPREQGERNPPAVEERRSAVSRWFADGDGRFGPLRGPAGAYGGFVLLVVAGIVAAALFTAIFGGTGPGGPASRGYRVQSVR